MTRVSSPRWLDEPQEGWLVCQITQELSSDELVVEIAVDGQERSIIVPDDVVRIDNGIPGSGEIRVTVVARLPADDPFGDGLLTELPAVPVNGTQRLRIRPDAFAAR